MRYTFNLKTLLLATCLVVPLLFGNVIAQDEAPAAEAAADYVRDAGNSYSNFMVDNLWILIAAFLVFLMHPASPLLSLD